MSSVIGDQYLFSESKEGKIVFANDRYIDKVMINYDAYERMVYFSVDNYRRMIEPENLKNFSVGPRVFEPFEFEGKSYVGEKLVSSDNVILIESALVTLKEPTYNPALDMGSRDYIYKQKSYYFIQLKGDSFLKLKSNSNKNIKVLGVDGLKEYIKNNNLSWDDRNDLLQIMSFIDSNI